MIVIRMRHAIAPGVHGCRWCGFGESEHGIAWAASKGFHAHAWPTLEQQRARHSAQQAKRIPLPETSPAEQNGAAFRTVLVRLLGVAP